MTQCERLAAEFEKGRELTMWEILHELRIGNHTGRISDLRAKGYEIDDIGTKGFGVYKMRRKKCLTGEKESLLLPTEPNSLNVENAELLNKNLSSTPTSQLSMGETHSASLVQSAGRQSINENTQKDTELPLESVCAENADTIQNTRFRMYQCAKGHRGPYYGQPEKKVRCDQCNWQEWAFLEGT